MGPQRGKRPALPPGKVDIEEVEARIRRIQGLGASPYVVTKILRVSQSASAGARELAAVVGADHALTAKLLKIANSAFYGSPGQTTRISQAVTRVGFRGVLELAMGISVLEAFKKGLGKGGLDRKGFWKHSLSVALVSRRLALHMKYPAHEEAFVAGLLHDIGKPLLEECFPAEYRRTVEQAARDGVPIRTTERETFGADHGFFGGLLLREWGLPAGAVHAVTHHHHHEHLSSLEDPRLRTLLRIVHLADALCKAAAFGNAGDLALEDSPPEALREAAGVAPKLFDLLQVVDKETGQYQQFLEIEADEKWASGKERPLQDLVVEVLIGSRQHLSALATVLRRAGAQAHLSEQVKLFNERIRSEPPDAAVLDTGEPDLNLRVLEHLPQPLAGRTVCFVNPEAREQIRQAGRDMDGFFTKPCFRERILARLAGAGGPLVDA